MPKYKALVRKVSIPLENKIKQKEYLPKGRYPVIDQGQKNIGGFIDDFRKIVRCNLPVIVFGDHTKSVKYVDFPFVAGADGIKVLEAVDGVYLKYLYYATLYLTYKIEDKGYARHYQHLEKKEVNVPEYEQQKRVVAHIEKLFSQLDASEATLRTVKEQLAVYRQAVLKEAFSSFTEKTSIREISSIVTSGSRGWAKYYADEGARFIRITDLTRDRTILKNENPQYVILPDDAEGRRTHLQPHDVLVSITADLGSIALIPNEIGEAYVNQHIAMIRFLNPKQAEFMAWYLKSDFGQKELLKNKRGAGKLGLGLDDIRDTTVPVVSDDIANAVVRGIDDRLSICESIEKSILQCFQQSQALRQSILKQAFEGDL